MKKEAPKGLLKSRNGVLGVNRAILHHGGRNIGKSLRFALVGVLCATGLGMGISAMHALEANYRSILEGPATLSPPLPAQGQGLTQPTTQAEPSPMQRAQALATIAQAVRSHANQQAPPSTAETLAENLPTDGRSFFSRTQTKAGDKQLPIYSVETPLNQVAISFDAAWGADDTDELLRILEEHGVTTTFFLCGFWVGKYPDEVRRIHEAGHDIGNHGETHAHGRQLSKEANMREIMLTHNRVKELLGIEMNLFRPPFGEYNNTVLQAADAVGYFTVQWDVDSHDWMNRGTQYEIDRVLNNPNLGNVSIILFHNDAPNTPRTLATIIQGLQAKGFEIVPISQLIHKENFQMDHAGRQHPTT